MGSNNSRMEEKAFLQSKLKENYDFFNNNNGTNKDIIYRKKSNPEEIILSIKRYYSFEFLQDLENRVRFSNENIFKIISFSNENSNFNCNCSNQETIIFSEFSNYNLEEFVNKKKEKEVLILKLINKSIFKILNLVKKKLLKIIT